MVTNYKSSKDKLTIYFIFTAFFIFIGFPLGTFVLRVILRSLLFYLRQKGTLVQYENQIVIVTIILLAVITFFITRWIWRWFHHTSSTIVKYSLPIALALVFSLTLHDWYTPSTNLKLGELSYTPKGRFALGPYPDYAMLVKLKNNNFTGVISLLSPKVIPFEPTLIEREKRYAQQLGLKFIHIPMVPWIRQNTEARKKVKKLVKSLEANDKYYVHCYLGRDRNLIFLKMANKFTDYKLTADINSCQKILQQQKNDKHRFSYIKLGQTLFGNSVLLFVPKPCIISTPNEYIPYSLKNIIDINTRDSKSEVQTLKQSMTVYDINYHNINMTHRPYDPYQAYDLLNWSDKLASYTIFTDFSMPPKSIPMESLMITKLTQLPAIPSHFVSKPLKRGTLIRIAPNIVIGPRPELKEYGRRLFKMGVRNALYIGACSSQNTKYERIKANTQALDWYCSPPDIKAIIEQLKSKGPWFIYGPQLNQVASELYEAYKPQRKNIQKIYRQNK